jgi:hypothetical protein
MLPTWWNQQVVTYICSQSIHHLPLLRTGLGGWSVVSVTEVETVKVIQEPTKRALPREGKATVSRTESVATRQADDHLSWDTDDALAVYDPYGTNLYKGVSLTSADSGTVEDEALSIAKGANVTFKKRSRPTESAADRKPRNTIRSFRTKEDE